VAIWPSLSLPELAAFAPTMHEGYAAYLATLTDADLEQPVAYVNSAGLTFTNTVVDILMHVALHGQYHRGKVNLLLRQAGAEPALVDFIAFQRGVPAARTPWRSSKFPTRRAGSRSIARWKPNGPMRSSAIRTRASSPARR